MIELYHCNDARSFRALWALEELGLDYRLHMLPFPPRAYAKEFLGENILGTVPYLIDGAERMTESSAIPHYLATRYGPSPLAVAPEEPGYGAYLNGLFHGEATLTFPQTLVLRYRFFEPEERRLPQAAEDYAQWFLGRLRFIDSILETSDYAAAGRFTMADISIGYALKLAFFTKLSGELPERVLAYWRRLECRDGYQRAMAAQAREQELQLGKKSGDF